ncbi:MAG TPA: transglutaminase-like cysteine peptidase [Alphaproteobacteria bacterium]|nr:transglutaminase-like cysteine peptidase [Alphaproteobacteria bacterium]
MVAVQPAAGGEPSYPPLFGSREVRSANLGPFQKWTGMVERQAEERGLYDGPCTARRFNRCHLVEWRQLLRDIAALEPLAQLEAVNSFMNRAPYITDPVNYGVPDYWATPLQFLSKDGDCEDYAIAKFVSLRQLGFQSDQLRVVVVDDLNLRIPHAILVVYVAGRAYVLDNQISRVVPAEVINHYRPIYSINEQAWWLHRR